MPTSALDEEQEADLPRPERDPAERDHRLHQASFDLIALHRQHIEMQLRQGGTFEPTPGAITMLDAFSEAACHLFLMRLASTTNRATSQANRASDRSARRPPPVRRAALWVPPARRPP
jgi:hypothetical protein